MERDDRIHQEVRGEVMGEARRKLKNMSEARKRAIRILKSSQNIMIMKSNGYWIIGVLSNEIHSN